MHSIYKNISYKTYMNIKKLTISTIIASLIAASHTNNPTLLNIDTIITYSMALNYLYMTGSNSIDYTKEINEIYTIYQEYLDNYLKLSKELANNDPIEISTLYYTMRKHGYLSTNKCFKGKDQDIIENNRILGANIMNGTGVCRHISCLLKDILKKYGYDAYPMTVNIRKYCLINNIFSESTKTKEELLDWLIDNIYDDELFNESVAKLEKYPNVTFELFEDKEDSFLKNIFANHAITYVNHNKTNYFIDSTQGSIYNLNKEKNILYDNANYAKIKILGSYIIGNSFKDIIHINESVAANHNLDMTNYGNTPFNKAEIQYKNYKSILDDYYQENLPLLNELTMSLNSFKKRCLKK